MSGRRIVEVVRRSEQGVTRPFLCRADDGALYWVKGAGAGRRALCCEWIAGRLAQCLGLPIPVFRTLSVDSRIVELSARPDIGDLGAGAVFGSGDLPMAQELAARDVGEIDSGLRLRILMFDWWVQNADRTLGERGGNPNLLRIPGKPEVAHVIDHNVAFAKDFDPDSFFDDHAFGQMRKAFPPEAILEVRQGFVDTVARSGAIWRELPPEWLYLDSDGTMPVDLSEAGVAAILERINTEFDRDWVSGS